ncbi:MAG TPA: hypothetical protein DD434_06500 [Bacteroidales bacterium]|nr:hypothetical protein [Bacteroidales bacterium]
MNAKFSKENDMGNIIEVIEKETSGKSFKSHKYCHDTTDRAGIDYDDNQEVIWKEYGETEKFKNPKSLELDAKKRVSAPSIFSFFLDGSRHTYKVDDISYNKNVYPVIAGQVGVGCCERREKLLKPALLFERKLVIALPNKAFSGDEWHEKDKANNLLIQINKIPRIKNQLHLDFNDLLIYSTDKDESYDKKGIAKIQDYMVELEKQIVADLVAQGRLDEDNYLIKDGSLEYPKVSKNRVRNNGGLNLSDAKIANNYRYVVGVSKSFNPTKCYVEGGGSNSDIIAKLKVFERTPAFRYTSTRADVDFCIWYLRIRDARYTGSIFDGILKIEKLIITDKEKSYGIDTDEIDNISAHILNERNPVCYGKDARWANHLYPIYLTESFIKSKYISNDMFMQLF